MVNVGGVLFGGVFALVGFAIVAAGMVRFRRWWTMRRMDPTDGLSLDEGLQEIEGTAHAVDGTTTAPFSGTESLVCKYKVERYRYDDDGSNWTTKAQETKTVPFELEQDGNNVVVHPEDAQKLLTDEFVVDTGKTSDVPARVQNYLGQNSGTSIELGPIELGGGSGRYRFTEERLDDGEEVYVLGETEQAPTKVPAGSNARWVVDPDQEGWKEKALGDPFVLSDSGEGKAEWRQLKSSVGLSLFGAIFAGAGVVVIYLTSFGG